MENLQENSFEKIIPEKIQKALNEYEKSMMDFIKNEEDEIRNGTNLIWVEKFNDTKKYQKEVFVEKVLRICEENIDCMDFMKKELSLNKNQKADKGFLVHWLTMLNYSDKFKQEIERVKNSSVDETIDKNIKRAA